MFVINTLILLKCSKNHLISSKCFLSALSETTVPRIVNKDIKFYMKLYGTNYAKTTDILNKYNPLERYDKESLSNSAAWLQANNFPLVDIQKHPTILYQCPTTLENRVNVFKEIGVTDITVKSISKYITLMNKTVHMLKLHKVIPADIDITTTLSQHLKHSMEFPDIFVVDIDRKTMNEARKLVLNNFLQYKLCYSTIELEKLWRIYPRIRHKSFATVIRTIDILQNELGFTKERIVKNGYVLHADPDNVLEMIKRIEKIGNNETRDVLRNRPKIMMSKWESIQQISKYMQDYGISETSIDRCWEIFTLGPSTVLERLNDLKNTKEFEALRNHPRVIRLVHHQKKARLRLEYLQQLKIKCASLHILSAGSDVFEKYAREGVDKTKGGDVISLLSKYFKRPITEVRNCLIRHPNWTHVPITSVKSTLDYLSAIYKPADIFKNVFLLLYPVKLIKEKIHKIKNDPELMKSKITPCQLLGLCLYYIELDFHFTGDGIWEEPIQQIDTFITPLPEMPASLAKNYRYGLKPSDSRKEIGQRM